MQAMRPARAAFARGGGKLYQARQKARQRLACAGRRNQQAGLPGEAPLPQRKLVRPG